MQMIILTRCVLYESSDGFEEVSMINIFVSMQCDIFDVRFKHCQSHKEN